MEATSPSLVGGALTEELRRKRRWLLAPGEPALLAGVVAIAVYAQLGRDDAELERPAEPSAPGAAA